MAMFNSFLYVYQRVNIHFPMVFLWFSHENLHFPMALPEAIESNGDVLSNSLGQPWPIENWFTDQKLEKPKVNERTCCRG